MKRDMARAGLASCTQKEYLAAVRHMLEFLGRELETLTPGDIRAWDDEMHRRGLSAEWMRVHMAAITFLFKRTLGKPEMVCFLRYPTPPWRAPEVLSQGEAKDVLDHFFSMRYRVFFALMYDTGMRISEVVRLKAEDIDKQRGVIHVLGKGNKVRQVKLGDNAYELLRQYWREVRIPEAPKGTLSEESLVFVSTKGGPISMDTARKALRQAVDAAGIKKKVCPHTLRHSYTTHQLENGTDLAILQAQLGHASILTTQQYLRISARLIASAPSPLDRVP